MNKAELEKAIKSEVNQWPDVEVEFVSGGKHPKAKFKFGKMILSQPYPGTPSDNRTLHNTLGNIRRVMKKLGAERSAPEPSKAEDEKKYSPPNEGKKKRPAPARKKAKAKPDLIDQLVAEGVVSGDEAETARAEAKEVEPDHDDYEAMGVSPGEAEVLRKAELESMVRSIVDGIYFGLPEEIYHAVPRLSSSGLQNLLVSPAYFWKNSWLNPVKVEEQFDEEATAAQVLGKAYHCARLEPERLDRDFIRKISKSDFDQSTGCWNGTDIGNALADLGCPKKISGENVAEQAERLEAEGYDGVIWPLEEARWKRSVGKREPINGELWDILLEDMKQIRNTPDINAKLVGGASEVSVFWTDKNGIKQKCRFDYLKASEWSDFKTFENPMRKELDKLLADAMRFNRYYVQAGQYREGAEAIRTGGLQIIGEASDEQRALIAQIQIRPEELICWFIFQEKSGIPNLLAKEFRFYAVPFNTKYHNAIGDDEGVERVEDLTRDKTMLFKRAERDIDKAKRRFALYSEVYQAGEKWAPIEPLGSFSDDDFNQYWLEGYNE